VDSQTILKVLGGAASLVAVMSFLSNRQKQPAHLAPGVEYEATVRLAPAISDELATRIIAAQSGEVLELKQGRSATIVRYRFTAFAPREVHPGETLFAFEGRKATLVRIREV
jgi:hypothetical protein